MSYDGMKSLSSEGKNRKVNEAFEHFKQMKIGRFAIVNKKLVESG